MTKNPRETIPCAQNCGKKCRKEDVFLNKDVYGCPLAMGLRTSGSTVTEESLYFTSQTEEYTKQKS